MTTERRPPHHSIAAATDAACLRTSPAPARIWRNAPGTKAS